MTEKPPKKENLTKLVRMISILANLSPTRKMGVEGLVKIIPSIQGAKFADRTLQRDLLRMLDVLPICSDSNVPRGYRLQNTAEGHAIGNLARLVYPYFHGKMPEEAMESTLEVYYRVQRACKSTAGPLEWESQFQTSSAFYAYRFKEEAELKAGQDYSGPQYVFRVVKITEEPLN